MTQLPALPAAQRTGHMRQILDDHPAEALTGAVVTVRGRRIRLSRAAATRGS